MSKKKEFNREVSVKADIRKRRQSTLNPFSAPFSSTPKTLNDNNNNKVTLNNRSILRNFKPGTKGCCYPKFNNHCRLILQLVHGFLYLLNRRGGGILAVLGDAKRKERQSMLLLYEYFVVSASFYFMTNGRIPEETFLKNVKKKIKGVAKDQVNTHQSSQVTKGFEEY